MQQLAPHTDYVYDPKDIARVKSAFHDLQKSEERGYIYGLGTWIFSYWAFGKTFNWGT